MSTSPDPTGVPFLPPRSGTASPEAIAIALDDPQLLEQARTPYLPPSGPPRPAIVSPAPVFDAKAMVDAMKGRVENPVYGHMPAGTPEGRAAAEEARARMRRKRRRSKILGWTMACAFIAFVGGVGYAVYAMYQHDQDVSRPDGAGVTVPSTEAPLTTLP